MGVGVLRVDREPSLNRVPSAFAVGALAGPVRLGQPLEDLRGRLPGGPKGVQRRLDGTVVGQAPCVLVLMDKLFRNGS